MENENGIQEVSTLLEEMLIDITRQEEEARRKKEMVKDEARKMVDKTIALAREAEIADKASKSEIFKEELRKFENEGKQLAAELLESGRKQTEKEVIEPAQKNINAVTNFLEEKFLSLEWFK